MRAIFHIFIVVIFGLPLTAGAASDRDKEARWAEQIRETLFTGKPVELEADGGKFLALWTEETADEPRGGLILVHGMGAHPDWPEVIHPLRTRLPERGWSTLSIQAPVLPNEAGFGAYAPLIAEAGPRIEAALAFFQERDIKPVFLLGHSLGSLMAAAWVASWQETEEPPLAGLVLIGMPTVETPPELAAATYLRKIEIPVLDLYGSRDLDRVRAGARLRRATARKSGNEAYRQVEVLGAGHFFTGLEDELVRRIHGWLTRTSREDKSTEPDQVNP